MSRIIRGQAAFFTLTAILALAACGTPASAPAEVMGGEKTSLEVGVLPIPDAAPLYIARDKGFFREEGLVVHPVIIQGGAVAQPKIESGALDITQTNYVSAFLAADRGRPIKIIADLYHAAPGAFQLMVPGSSPIRNVSALKGKTILVNNLRNIGTLAVTATLARAGVKEDDVTFAERPFPEMANALEAGQGDAAWMTEPFITAGERRQRLRALADTMTHELTGLPIAGWAVTDQWAAEHPKALAGFRRAMARAQRLAAGSKDEVVAVLPSYTPIGDVTAREIAFGRYPQELKPAQLQRVADLMLRHAYISRKLDVRKVVVPS
jgi:NitT/TauT family transport system substrate-binding protein